MANFKDEPVQQVTPPQNPQEGQAPDAATQKIIQQAKGYETVLKNLIHSRETRDDVIEMLKAQGDAILTVPQAAMTINDMGLQTMKQGGVNVPPAVQMVASAYLIDDLITLGEASGSFQVEEQDIEHIMEDTYQMYIERGLKDKSIDPIQLQLEVEKGMTQEQTAGGLMVGRGEVPERPTEQMMTEQQIEGRVHEVRQSDREALAKKEAVGKRDALTQQALAQKQEGGQ